MPDPSLQSMPYLDHDRVFRNGASIILQQIIIAPIIVHHILVQHVGSCKELAFVPDASRSKTTHKKDVEEKPQRRYRNPYRGNQQNNGPQEHETAPSQVVPKQDKATHYKIRSDSREMVIMHRETFDILVKAKYLESTDSNKVIEQKQKGKICGIVELIPKPTKHHEGKAVVKPLKSAMRMRRTGGEQSKQQEAVPMIDRHVSLPNLTLSPKRN